MDGKVERFTSLEEPPATVRRPHLRGADTLRNIDVTSSPTERSSSPRSAFANTTAQRSSSPKSMPPKATAQSIPTPAYGTPSSRTASVTDARRAAAAPPQAQRLGNALTSAETSRGSTVDNAPTRRLSYDALRSTQSADVNSAESAEPEVRVKGINFTTALDAVQRLYSPAARTRIEKETEGAIGDALRFGGIVVGGWYPVSWYREFWKSLHDKLGVDEAAARRIGHRAAGIGVNVVYRTLARMSSPSMLLSMSARAFGYFYEPATLVVKQPEPKRLTAEWRGCFGFDRLIWSELEGGATYFIEATGATGVNFTIIAGGGTSNFMLATATWR